MRCASCFAATTPAFVSNTRLRPVRYTSSSGVSYAGGVPRMAQWVGAYTSRIVNSTRIKGSILPAKTGACSKRSSIASSAASHARPTETYTGSTREVCASCAANTALSSPPDSKTTEVMINETLNWRL